MVKERTRVSMEVQPKGDQRFSKEDKRMVERWCMRQALEPIQAMVESKELSPDQALAIIAQGSGQFSENDYSEGYKKFKANSALIYAHEPFFNINYRLPSGDKYNFKKPSVANVAFMHKLHQSLSGKGFDSPQILKNAMEAAVSGKRILEIGSGPGFNLKILKDLGANVSGIEIRKEFVGKIQDVDVRHGDASRLGEIFGKERFDIIYSTNVFCHDAVDLEKPDEIVGQMCEYTKEGGLQVHLITYTKMTLAFYLMGFWLSNREVGRDQKEMEEFFWNELPQGKPWGIPATQRPQRNSFQFV